VRSQNCELQDLAKELGVDENRFEGENIHYPLDNFSPSIVRDPNKCILCRRCVAVCRNVQKIGAIGAVNRGFKTVIAPAFGKTMLETDCVFCASTPARSARCASATTRTRFGMRSPTQRSSSSCSPLRPSAWRWARNSACPSAPASPAR
jgi:predicted molibdopterin-dependent oxidoreductase YjgC